MSPVIVTTKEQLEAAKKARASEIIVEGKLASDLRKAKAVAKLSAVCIAVLAAAIGFAPVTGGLSVGAAAGAAALTGVEISAIIIASAIGLSLVIAVSKDYEEIGAGVGNMHLKLRKFNK